MGRNQKSDNKVKNSKVVGTFNSGRELLQGRVILHGLQKFAALRNFAGVAKLRNFHGLLHLSVMLPILSFSAQMPIDFFMLELNPYLWYKKPVKTTKLAIKFD